MYTIMTFLSFKGRQLLNSETYYSYAIFSMAEIVNSRLILLFCFP